MASTQSAEEVRTELISLMGSDLGSLYDELRTEVAWLHIKWNRFLALFAEAEERIDLMNNTAPAFFREAQRLMAEDVFMHISRLTDRPEMMVRGETYQRLTLARLATALGKSNLRSTIDKKLEKLEDQCNFARDWRNRRIAHRDLALAMETPDYKPLEGASGENVECALAAIRDVMNTVLLHFKESVVGYEHGIPAMGDAEALLHYVKLGLQAEQARFDSLRQSANPPHESENAIPPAPETPGPCSKLTALWRILCGGRHSSGKPRT